MKFRMPFFPQVILPLCIHTFSWLDPMFRSAQNRVVLPIERFNKWLLSNLWISSCFSITCSGAHSRDSKQFHPQRINASTHRRTKRLDDIPPISAVIKNTIAVWGNGQNMFNTTSISSLMDVLLYPSSIYDHIWYMPTTLGICSGNGLYSAENLE